MTIELLGSRTEGFGSRMRAPDLGGTPRDSSMSGGSFRSSLMIRNRRLLVRNSPFTYARLHQLFASPAMSRAFRSFDCADVSDNPSQAFGEIL
jgi:hypothetical protein